MLKVLMFVPVLLLAGCAGDFACKERMLAVPSGFTSQIMMSSCGAGGDLRPGMTSERGFVFQKDSVGNETVTSLDTAFASEGSTKNKGLEIVNTGVQGGLQAVTAGQFKPTKVNSNINGGDVTANQNNKQSNVQSQQQEASARATAEAASNASASSVVAPPEKKTYEPRHYRPTTHPEHQRKPEQRWKELNRTQPQHKKEY